MIDLPFALPTIVAGPDAARAVRASGPVRHRRRLLARRDPARAALRDASLRRPDGAARAARARPRDGGGGGVARRERASGLQARRLPEPLPGRPLRRRARVRAGDRRVRLRRADLGEPALQDRGRLRLHLRADRERRPVGRRRRLGRPARRSPSRPCS